MARLVLATAGAVVGSALGGPVGAQIGWTLGSLVGGTFEPNQKQAGPRLNDLAVSGSAYGATIPYVAGSPRIAGQIIWASTKRENASTETQGKGGGGGVETTSYSYEVDLLILLTDNEIVGVGRMWRNGELVLNGQAKEGLWSRMTVYKGDAAQLPDPTYEAAVGMGNAPAYRGRGCVFIEGLQLGNIGQVPNLTSEIGTGNAGNVVCLQHFDVASMTYQGPLIAAPSYTETTYSIPAAIGPQWQLRGFASGGYSTARIDTSAGMIGDAGYLFDSTRSAGASMSVLTDSTFAAAADFTIELAWKPNGESAYNSGSDIVLASNGNYSGTPGDWILKTIGTGSGFGRYFSFSIDGGGSVSTSPTYPEASNSFTGIVRIGIVRDGAELRIYINGDLRGTTSGVPVVTTSSGNYLNIGASGAGPYLIPNDYGVGMYDEFIYAVGSAEFKGSRYTPKTGPYPNSGAFGSSSKSTITVQALVNQLLALSGLSPSQYDTADLASITRPVRALAVGQVSNVRNTLEVIASSYQFDAVLSDKLYFRKRAGASVASIPYADLGCDGGDPFALRLANELEVPAQMAITYANMDNDYQTDTQYSDRLLTGQESTSAVQLPLGMLASEAKALADGLLTDKAISMTSTTIAIGQAYAKYEPCDVLTVLDSDATPWRMRVIKKSTTDGLIKLDLVMDDGSVYVQTGTTTEGTQGQTEVAQIIPATFQLMDIPLLRDADNTPGFYIAIGGGPAAIYESTDNTAFNQVTTSNGGATIGTCTTILPSWSGGGIVDELSSVTVNVGGKQLSSITRADMLASAEANTAVIGSEILQYENATLVSAGVYTLTGLLRGRQDTATTGHIAGETFVLLSGGGVKFIPLQASDLGRIRYYKAAATGQTLSSVASKSITPQGINLTPFAPYNLRAQSTSTEVQVTWSRKTRLSENWLAGLVPLGESSEQYDVELYNGGTLVTSATVTTPSWSSPLALTGYTVKVYQVSATVGRGAVASIVVAADYSETAPPPLSAATLTLSGTAPSGATVVVYDPPSILFSRVVSGVDTLTTLAAGLAADFTTAGYPATSSGPVVSITAPPGSGFGASPAYRLATMSVKVLSSATVGLEVIKTGAPVSPGASAVWNCYLSNAVDADNEVIRAGNAYSVYVYRANQMDLISLARFDVVNPVPASRYEALIKIKAAVDANTTLTALGYSFILQADALGKYSGWMIAPVGESDVYITASSIPGFYPESFNAQKIASSSPIVPAAIEHVVKLSILGTVATGQVFNAVITGVGTFSYTATGGDTNTSVATALAAVLDASASFAATSSGAIITLTASTAGIAYAITTNVGVGLTIVKS